MKIIEFEKQLNSNVLNLPIPNGMIGEKAKITVWIEPDSTVGKSVKTKKRVPGTAKGMIKMADDFEKPLNEEMLADFYK